MRKLPDWSFDLLLVIGGICSIIAISGLLMSASGFGTWIITSPFVAPAQSQPFRNFAIQAFITTLPFFGGSIAIALTANTLIDAEMNRSERQERIKLSQQLDPQQHSYAIAATNSLLFDLAETQRRVRDLELRLNDRIDEQIRLLNRIAELEEAVYGSSEDTDFYPAETATNLSSPPCCQYLNEGLIRCAVHPNQIDCEGCRDYCDQ
ncbi:MAG: hypothetical protein MUC48_05070 [Leptolyngbya sp. Prado105]|jgi:hypothetical protein|nr:hypothetical protein [Leptolyngbya sp. Prado105]